MKNTICLFLLTSALLFTCQNEDPVESVVTCEGVEVPLVGIIPEECFTYTVVEEDFYAFRGTMVRTFDLDDDGETDVDLIIKDESFGIAGGTRANIKLALAEGYEVECIFLEDQYCTRWWFGVMEEPDDSPVLAYRIDGRNCAFYTEEELADCDTVVVETLAAFMVQSYELNEQLSDQELDWFADTVLIASLPKQVGDLEFDGSIPYDDSSYIVFRKMVDGEFKYGWLEIIFKYAYGVPGTIKSYGFMN